MLSIVNTLFSKVHEYGAVIIPSDLFLSAPALSVYGPVVSPGPLHLCKGGNEK